MTRLLSFLFLTIFAAGFFIFQIYWINLPPVYFLFIFLLCVVPIADLISPLAAIYSTSINASLLLIWSLIMGHSKIFYIMALLQIVIVIYYLLVKKLSSDKYQKIKKSENYFRRLINTSLHPIIVKNSEGEIVLASESINKLLGLKKSSSLDKNITDLIHPDDTRQYLYFIKQLTTPNQKKSTEVRFKKNDSSWIWVKIEGINLLGDKELQSTLLTLQDITLEKDTDFQKSELLKQEIDARSVAEKAIRDRDEFLSIASHELKTPLTSVILLLQSTLKKILTQSLADFSGSDLLNSLRIVEKQSQSLSRLIKDLLNVSLASTGRLTLNKETIDLNQVVEGLIEKYSEDIRISSCEVEYKNNEKEIIGNWDAIRIEQAITNLLTNALKYAKGTKINLETKREKGVAVFTISDKGVGIEKELQQVIFKPFQRGSNSQYVKGLGVGLFISKQIAEAHGGDIKVYSKPGKGTKFTLLLPLDN